MKKEIPTTKIRDFYKLLEKFSAETHKTNSTLYCSRLKNSEVKKYG